MPKKRKQKTKTQELDSIFFLKLILYLVLGSLWVRVVNADQTSQIPLPVGFAVGLLFAHHEHFRIDRKIEYALLLTAMFVSYWLPIGISFVR